MRKSILTAALLGAFISSAGAATIRPLGGIDWDIEQGASLNFSAVQPGGNQPQNNPCIICGATQPNQTNTALNFGYTDFGNTGNVSTQAFFSSGILRDTALTPDTISLVNYTGAQLQAVVAALGGVNGGFSIGIDVNDTNKAQTLESFFLLDLTTTTVVYSFLPGLNDGIDLIAAANGTGFPDFQLTGLNASLLDPNHQYAFFARMTNLNDGPDSFFIVPDVQLVPGPIVGAGIPGIIAGCMALVGLAGWRRRRNALTA